MRPLPLLLALLWAAPLLAATPLEAARAQASEAREAVGALTREQLALRKELGALSGRIETLKAARSSDGELDAALKQSQALSSTLTSLAQQLASQSQRSEQAHLTLYTALSQELSRLRSLFSATAERPRRATLLGQMRALRAEQERVRPLLPAALVPPLPPGAAGGDDPEDLLEQVDALRDTEDRVRARLVQVEARLKEARAEQELSRRMDDFLGSEALFDEQDRRLRPRGTGVQADVFTGDRADGEARPPPTSPGTSAGTPPSVPTSPAPEDHGISGGPHGFTAPETPTSRLPPEDVRPLVGQVRREGLAAEELEDVAALEALHKRLTEQARSYGQRAAELEKRARELQ